MGDGHGFDEMLLEAGFHRCLDLLDLPHHVLDLNPGLLIEQCDARPGAGGVARRGHVRQIAVGHHAEHHGVLDVDMTAERAGQAHPIHLLDAHAIHEQPHAGVQRRLGELHRPHVVLGDA